MNKNLTFIGVALFSIATCIGQSILSEKIEFRELQAPKNKTDENSRTFKVTVTSPYNLTAEDVIANSKKDFKQAEADYDNVLSNSEKEYQKKLKEYDAETVKAKEKYEIESTEFKKLSMLERLTMTDAGKNPKLVLPSKPEYVKPYPPVYREPNLSDYTIVDNNVLASQININGFTRGAGVLDISVDIKPVKFQDNAGQTYANQPTKIIAKLNGVEKVNGTFFEEFNFISSAPTNNINKPLEEKHHLEKVVKFINDYLNKEFGYSTVTKTVEIESVKNKGKYDDLARADIYVTTNLKKLQPENKEVNDMAYANMQKGIDIWTQTLEKIEYKNPKADFNPKIAEFVFFNLIRLNLALNRKADAEKYLNQLQENLIYIKLGSSEERELNNLEKAIYALNK